MSVAENIFVSFIYWLWRLWAIFSCIFLAFEDGLPVLNDQKVFRSRFVELGGKERIYTLHFFG